MVTPDRDISLLVELARKLRSNPDFMSHVLFAYQQQEQLSEEDLADQFGAAPEMVVRLSLCKRPIADSPTFASEIRDLSDFTLIDETVLAHVIRQVDSLNELAHLIGTGAHEVGDTASATLTGLLAAARDRDGAEPEHEDGSVEESKS